MFSHIFKNHFIFSFCELFLHSFFPFFYWSIFFPKSFLHILDKMLFCDINCNIFPIFNCFFCCLQDICPFRGGFFFIFMYLNITIWRGSRAAGSAVVVAICKCTRTTEILWRKRDCVAALQVRERAFDPHLDRLLLFFWAHYMEDSPHLLCTGSPQVITF